MEPFHRLLCTVIAGQADTMAGIKTGHCSQHAMEYSQQMHTLHLIAFLFATTSLYFWPMPLNPENTKAGLVPCCSLEEYSACYFSPPLLHIMKMSSETLGIFSL